MRANAPIPAPQAHAALSLKITPLLVALCLAASLLLSLPAEARTKVHKPAARQTTTTRHHPKPTLKAAKSKRKSAAKPSPRHTTKVVAKPTRRRRKHAATQPAKAAPRSATPNDFLRAATTPDPEADTPEAPTSKRAPRPKSPAATQRSVVSVIRPMVDRPQLAPVAEEASTPVILPSLYNKRGRLIVPRPLKGSREILLHQNEVADREGLDRVQDDTDLTDMRTRKILVEIPVSSALVVDDRLPANRRYCRPWTAQFLITMSRAYYARFHVPLQVNSAVRTVEFQQRLIRTNGNAAPAEGETASPHLTGQAVDVAKHGLNLTQISWLRGYLLPLTQQSKIDVEEEFKQACFHISVYKKYLPPAPAQRRAIASAPNAEAATLATAIH